MSSLLLPRQQKLNQLFHLMVVFAVLGPTLGVPVIPGFKLTLFRLFFLTLAAGLFIRWARSRDLESSHMHPVRWYTAFFAFWVVYAAVSLTWAGSLGLGLKYLTFLVTMLLLCLSFPFFLKGSSHIEQTGRVLFWAFFIIVVYGLIESVTYWHLPASRYFGRESSNVTSFFSNQNDFATAITLGLPFLVTALYMLAARRKAKVLIYLTGIITLCDLFLTGSRSNSGFALPLVAVTWLALIPFTVERSKRNFRNLLKGAGLLLLAVVVTGGLLSSVLSDQTRSKLGSTLGVFNDLQSSWTLPNEDDIPLDEEEASSRDQSISIRKALIMNGLHFLARSHYLGVGAGNIEYYMLGAPGVGAKSNIHNWWAEVLVNFGVGVFLLYMTLYFWMLWRLFRLARVKEAVGLSPVIRWGATASFIALIGYFFGGMSPSTAIHFTPMWIVYGFALAVIAVGERQRYAARHKEEGKTAVSSHSAHADSRDLR
ncbi:O-antigen ligase family protein [Salinithrix halophila]|uniref:O-antigen ligase family protein n=1 Tax=Salinithrix halophila TaxID=1485204 RepID=A0ABV8JGA2_9BACL